MDNIHSPLNQKLGIKPGDAAFTLYAPSEYTNLLPEAIPLSSIDDLNQSFDWLQVFYKDKERLEQEFKSIKTSMPLTSQVWISWPKKSSGVASDLNDGVVRAVGISSGLVDVKVASINDVWSALKFVYRLKDR